MDASCPSRAELVCVRVCGRVDGGECVCSGGGCGVRFGVGR